MGFSQKGPKFDGKVSLNQTAHTLKEKDVKSSVFLKKTRFPRQNAWENVRQTRPLRRNPRDFWRLGPALLGRAAVSNAWGKGSLSPAARCVRAETHGRSVEKADQTTSNSARALFLSRNARDFGPVLVRPATFKPKPAGQPRLWTHRTSPGPMKSGSALFPALQFLVFI